MTSAVVKEGALLSTGELAPLRLLASGKVRDLFEVDADTLLVVSTDRISAFDVIMLNGVPNKGKVRGAARGGGPCARAAPTRAFGADRSSTSSPCSGSGASSSSASCRTT